MKKLILFTLMFLFLFSYVSAVRVDYSPNEKGVNDMKAVIKDTILWGLIAVGEQGTMELKSHKSPTEIIEVGTGWQVTMIYDTNFGQSHKDSLGKVYFYDLRTGEEVEREYKFVYWGTEERSREVCIEYQNVTNSTTKDYIPYTECSKYINESYTYEGWLDYNSKDLPKGQIKLGLMTNVLYKDKVDGVWEIQGKKIEKHAGWTSDLSVGLISYYKLDETSGTTATDSHGTNNGAISGATINQDGKIGKAYDFDGSNDYVQIGDGGDFKATSYTISLWFKTSDKIFQFLYGKDTGGAGGGYTQIFTNNDGRIITNAKGGTNAEYTDNNFNNSNWHHIVFVVSSTTTKLYYDGVDRDYGTVGTNTGGDSSNVYLARRDNGGYFNGLIDEVGIWSRALSSTEVSELYNSGTGITYPVISPELNISLLSPINYYNSSSSTIDFSANLTDEEELGITNVSLIINDTIYDTNTSGLTGIYNFSETLSDGFYEWYVEAYDNDSANYSSETRYFTIDTTPFIEFVSPTPANASNLSVDYIPVNVTVTEDYFENITFYFYKGGVLNETKTFTDGTRFYNKTGCTCDNWEINVTVCTTTGKCNSTETRLLIIDISPPEIEILSPVTSYDYLEPNQTIDLNVTITDEHLDSCWYTYEEVLLDTDSFETNNDDWILYNGSTEINRTEDWSSAGDYSVFITSDSSFPSGYFILNKDMDLTNINKIVFDTNIIYDAGLSKFGISLIGNEGYDYPDYDLYSGEEMGETNNITIDVSSYSGNYTLKFYGDFTFGVGGGSYSSFYIDNIRYYGYEPVNFNCSENQTFNYIQDLNNLTVYANDTFGNEGSESVSWTTLFNQLNLTYEEEVYEGVQNTFEVDMLLDGSLQQAYLQYNQTNYTTSVSYSGGIYSISSTVSSPLVDNDTNLTFSFWFKVGDVWYNLLENNQSVLTLIFGGCSPGDTVMLNISLLDEKLQTPINGTIEFNAYLTNKITSKIIKLANLSFSNVNLAQVCLEPLDAYDNYYLYSEMRYYKTDTHVSELYNIDKADLGNYPKNMSLYDLGINESTEFLITYKDDNFIKVEGAIIQLQRKYIAEDSYKVVEAPKTSSSGTAVVHVDLDSILYKAVVVKDGVVLDTFDNIVFHCENLFSGVCNQELKGEVNPENIIKVEDLEDFSYTITEEDNIITLQYSIPSGTSSDINIIMTQKDSYGNVTLCNQSIISSGGSLECDYADSITQSYITFEVLKDDELIDYRTYVIRGSEEINFLNNNYFIVVMLLLSLVGMAFTSPEWTIILSILTFLLAGGLYLLNGLNFVTGIGGLIWLVISAVIIITKLSQQEDR